MKVPDKVKGSMCSPFCISLASRWLAQIAADQGMPDLGTQGARQQGAGGRVEATILLPGEVWQKCRQGTVMALQGQVRKKNLAKHRYGALKHR